MQVTFGGEVKLTILFSFISSLFVCKNLASKGKGLIPTMLMGVLTAWFSPWKGWWPKLVFQSRWVLVTEGLVHRMFYFACHSISEWWVFWSTAWSSTKATSVTSTNWTAFLSGEYFELLHHQVQYFGDLQLKGQHTYWQKWVFAIPCLILIEA